jgi:hypothetical protein
LLGRVAGLAFHLRNPAVIVVLAGHVALIGEPLFP